MSAVAAVYIVANVVVGDAGAVYAVAVAFADFADAA